MRGATIRLAAKGDAAGCLAVYAPYVLDTAVSFETEVPKRDGMAERIAAAHLWLVAVTSADEVIGYAYASPHRERAAYRWATDVSVYLAAAAQRQGLGRALYLELFERLADRGFVTALAGVTLPNEASLGLHRALGFDVVGTYRHVGFKQGSWHDVCWLQRSLVDPLPVPPPALR